MAKRLATLHHAHHDLIVAAMPVTLDHEFRLETLALRGNALALRQFVDLLRAQRGGRHGKLNLISVGLHHAHRHARKAQSSMAAGGSPYLHVRPAH